MNNKMVLISLSAILLSLGLTLLFLGLDSERFHRTVFFFPSQFTGEIQGEARQLRFTEDPQKNMRLVVEEMLLQPMNAASLILAPRASRLNTLLFRDGVLYLDFNAAFLIPDPDIPVDVPVAFLSMEQTLKHNFRQIREIHFSVQGNPYLGPQEEEDKAQNPPETPDTEASESQTV